MGDNLTFFSEARRRTLVCIIGIVILYDIGLLGLQLFQWSGLPGSGFAIDEYSPTLALALCAFTTLLILQVTNRWLRALDCAAVAIFAALVVDHAFSFHERMQYDDYLPVVLWLIAGAALFPLLWIEKPGRTATVTICIGYFMHGLAALTDGVDGGLVTFGMTSPFDVHLTEDVFELIYIGLYLVGFGRLILDRRSQDVLSGQKARPMGSKLTSFLEGRRRTLVCIIGIAVLYDLCLLGLQLFQWYGSRESNFAIGSYSTVLAFALCVSAILLILRVTGPRQRALAWAAAAIFAVLIVDHAFSIHERMKYDDYLAVVLWLIAGAALFALLQTEKPSRIATITIATGFFIHGLAALTDGVDGGILTFGMISPFDVDLTQDAFEIAYIGLYLVGFGRVMLDRRSAGVSQSGETASDAHEIATGLGDRRTFIWVVGIIVAYGLGALGLHLFQWFGLPGAGLALRELSGVLALALSVLATAFLWRSSASRRLRLLAWAAAAVFAVLTVDQAFSIHERMNNDDYLAVLLWLVAGAVLFVLLRTEKPDRIAVSTICAGFILHGLAALADGADGGIFTLTMISPFGLGVSQHLLELAYIGLYLVGFGRVMLGHGSAAVALRTAPDRVVTVADEAGLGGGPHIALLTRGLRGGGVQVLMMNMAQELAGRGFDVDLVCRARRAKGLAPHGINVKTLADYPRLIGRILAWRADPAGRSVLARPVLFSFIAPEPLRILASLVRYLRSERPAALISATTYMNLVAIWARELAAVATRIVVSEHDHLSQHMRTGRDRGAWRWRYAPALLARLYPRADAIVAVSDGVADDLAERTGIDRARIRTIYNPIVTPDLVAKAAIDPQEPWLAPGMPPVILTAGRLVAKKDFATLLRAFARLRQTTEARLIILGDGPERRRLERLAQKLGVVSDLKFLGWVENPYAYMARAAVFASASIREGMPGVLIEAFACGCPVVATDCPSGPAEILDHGRYGRLVAPGDEYALAVALRESLATRPDPERLRRRAQIFAVRNATDAYLDLLGLPRRSPE